MTDEQARILEVRVFARPWAHHETDETGTATITTDEQTYVCSVPHVVARRIVDDHNAALRAADPVCYNNTVRSCTHPKEAIRP